MNYNFSRSDSKELSSFLSDFDFLCYIIIIIVKRYKLLFCFDIYNIIFE